MTCRPPNCYPAPAHILALLQPVCYFQDLARKVVPRSPQIGVEGPYRGLVVYRYRAGFDGPFLRAD